MATEVMTGRAKAAGSAASDWTELLLGWRLLLASLLGTGLGLPAVPFYSIGLFAPIFAAKFHWSYASIFGGLMVTTAVLVVGGPVIGVSVDRFGTRRVATASLVALGLSYMTLALSTGSVIQYYASWLAISVFGLGATPVAFTRAVTHGFSSRRGLALGVTLAGTGLFAVAAKPVAGLILEREGWRMAVLAVGALPLVVGAPAVWWGVREELQARPPRSSPPDTATGLTMKEALRARAFWLLVLTSLPISLAIAAPIPNLELILRSAHLEAGRATQVASLVGLTMVGGRLLGGWLMDKMWAPLTGALILAIGAGGCWLLSSPQPTYHQCQAAVLAIGCAAGIEFDLLSFLVARYLGLRRYGAIYATVYGIFALGAGCGPALWGYTYDRLGGFTVILSAAAGTLVCCGALLLTLGRYPNLSPCRSGGHR